MHTHVPPLNRTPLMHPCPSAHTITKTEIAVQGCLLNLKSQWRRTSSHACIDHQVHFSAAGKWTVRLRFSSRLLTREYICFWAMCASPQGRLQQAACFIKARHRYCLTERQGIISHTVIMGVISHPFHLFSRLKANHRFHPPSRGEGGHARGSSTSVRKKSKLS